MQEFKIQASLTMVQNGGFRILDLPSFLVNLLLLSSKLLKLSKMAYVADWCITLLVQLQLKSGVARWKARSKLYPLVVFF